MESKQQDLSYWYYLSI